MQVTMAEKQVADFMHIDPKILGIRLATEADIPTITEIYNEAVLNGVATFDTETKSIENRMDWFKQRQKQHPVMVACVGDKVAAWASLNKWSDRAAYDGTAEVSIYVHRDYKGQGIGSLLFAELVNQGEKLGLHYLLSRISQGNDLSIRLHQRNGFAIVGVMHEVGQKFGSYIDVTLMEKVFKNN